MDGMHRMMSWISWFCSRRGNEFFCEVDASYIQDTFSLTGLSAQVPHYNKALNLILDVESDDEEESSSDASAGSDSKMVEDAAKLLYGLIHVRYILTNKGIAQMLLKYKAGDFGKCPRHYCGVQDMLPIGLSDTPGESPVKLYCPKCKDVYNPNLYPPYQNADGAFFGTGFPHMVFFINPHYRPEPPQNKFIARLFGFKIHASVYNRQPEEEAISTAKDKTVARGQANSSSTSESS